MQTMMRSLAINFINLNKFSNIKQARKIFAWNTGKLFSLDSKLWFYLNLNFCVFRFNSIGFYQKDVIVVRLLFIITSKF
jgi:hypothetical protein